MPTTQFDSSVELQLDAMRLSAATVKVVLPILRKMERELIGRLSNATEWGRARINQQLAEVRTVIKNYYAEAASASTSAASGIAAVSAKVTASALSVGGSKAILPTAKFLTALSGKAIVQGTVQADWWARQSDNTVFNFANAVRQGLVSAETNQQIINRVRDVMDVSRSNAATLVQTSIMTVANDARQAVFDENEDIIDRYRAVATLDTNTCLECAPLDGKEWEKDGTPIGHDYSRPYYPLHYNCRCLIIPVVLGGSQGGQRASDEGPVDASLTFAGWLERQSKEKQEQVLGKGRTELYRADKITLMDLTSGTGRPLPLAQLKEKYT